ncbi:hypothetical protein Q670_14910 [Alcanivorax sp. P2S70]|nr:hypothetical protein Q670_14910 [Alcanivorax sp. P2S70]
MDVSFYPRFLPEMRYANHLKGLIACRLRQGKQTGNSGHTTPDQASRYEFMPKRIFRKYLPKPERLREQKSLRFLGELLSDPNLWHINRRSLAGAAFIGIFAGLLPIPLQMGLAAFLAVRFHCNLPLSVMLVWISNPVTYVPIFYFTYRIGAWILGMPPHSGEDITVAWFVEQLIPLWVGSVLCAMLFGGAAYLTVKVAWRLAVIRSWNLRARARARAQRRAARLEQTAQRDENKGEKEEETEGPRQS